METIAKIRLDHLEGRSDQEIFEGFEEHAQGGARRDLVQLRADPADAEAGAVGGGTRASCQREEGTQGSALFCGFMKTLGHGGGYDAVRRYARTWRRRWRLLSQSQAFVPLSFDPGEAYQFDWSHEYARLSGVTTKVKAAHMRLCYSRMQLVQIFPRARRWCSRRTSAPSASSAGSAGEASTTMKTGEHGVRGQEAGLQPPLPGDVFAPSGRACGVPPGAGWEKGQVERQVGDVRGRLFVPSPRGRSYAEINEWHDRCIEDAKKHPHPTIPGKTVSQVFEEERPFLMAAAPSTASMPLR